VPLALSAGERTFGRGDATIEIAVAGAHRIRVVRDAAPAMLRSVSAALVG
jgi:hypothetical protein